MRKIKSNFFISLDGVVESPDQWHFPYFDDAMGGAVGAAFSTSDAMLMGRVLYEEWAGYWPDHADEPFGDVINPIQKYVVSNTPAVGGLGEHGVCSAPTPPTGCASSRRPTAATSRCRQRHDRALAAARRAARRAQPARAPDRRRRRQARLFPADEPTVPLKLLSSETFPTGAHEPELRPCRRLTCSGGTPQMRSTVTPGAHGG